MMPRKRAWASAASVRSTTSWKSRATNPMPTMKTARSGNQTCPNRSRPRAPSRAKLTNVVRKTTTLSVSAWRGPTPPSRRAQACARPPAAAAAPSESTPAHAPLPPSQTRYAAGIVAAITAVGHPSKSAMSAIGTVRAST